MMNVIGLSKIVLSALVLQACQTAATKNEDKGVDKISQVESNLESPEVIELPAALDEISGHTFLKDNNQVLYCVQDELGVVYGYDLLRKEIVSELKFAETGDFEGIATDSKFFYVLSSNGDIYSFPVQTTSSTVEARVFKKLVGKGEYESLAIDESSQSLYILCKSCKDDRKKLQSTGYKLTYSATGEVTLDKTIALDLNSALELDSKFPKTFNPSAMTKKVSTKEWYILSSIDKRIVIANEEFKVVDIKPFSRKIYEQPEGLAFDSQENMYISSEKGEENTGKLFIIKK